MINGKTEGIRSSLLAEMESLYEIETDRDQFASIELLAAMAKYTGILGREISVYINRAGGVVDISIGDSSTVALQNIRLRRNAQRLSGLRCIHTHPESTALLSPVDIQSLVNMRFDAMAALSVRDGKPSAISCAFLAIGDSGTVRAQVEEPVGIYQIPQQEWMARIYEVDAVIGKELQEESAIEKALLIGLEDEESESMKELFSLAQTAGVEVLGFVTQKKPSRDPATYIGKGKAQEISLEAQSRDAQLCIFNDELSGAQIRNLENIIGCRVIDRTMLILDIFAGRAKSREGKLQVELAQLKYNSSRLTGLGIALSRLGGGIGTRGPGETKLETDRRHIRHRIGQLEREIKEIEKRRATNRARRERNEVPVVALVGYTNSGKSTLLNALSGASAFVQDALFATLDPLTRSIELPGGSPCLLVDTVGFISKLPHALVDAFKSTLEEALFADLLVIVADISNPNAAQQQEVVDDVLAQLGAKDKKRIIAYNKMDKAGFLPGFSLREAVAISAAEGTGLDQLLEAIEEMVLENQVTAELLVPYAKGNVQAFIHKYGNVLSEDYEDEGSRIKFTMDQVSFGRVQKMMKE
ncbi:MAG: GTPase HflX [Christensenellales bacterium]